MGLSLTVSEIDGDFSQKSRKISHPPCILHLYWRGSPWHWVSVLGVKKLEWWAIWQWKKFDDILSRLNNIPQCGRQADGHRVTAKIAITHSVTR